MTDANETIIDNFSEADLLDAPEACRALLVELIPAYQALRDTCETLREEYQKAKWRIDLLLQKMYGRKSEKFPADLPKLPGFDEETSQEEDEASADHEPEPIGHEEPELVEEKPTPKKKKHRGHGRGKLPAHLERREHTVDVDASEKTCTCCGREKKRIGEVRSERLDYEPPKVFVEVEVRPKYACCCEKSTVVIAEKPIRPIERGLPGLGLQVYVVIGKYVDHLPHYRQADRVLRRCGVTLSRQVLWDWTRATADLLRPLVDLMQSRLARCHLIGADETPVKMQLRKNSKVSMKQAYFWVYRGDDRAPYTVFDFQPTRAGEAPDEFLRDFTDGYLQCDGYTGYNTITSRDGVTAVCCWAHARRKFHESILSSPVPASEAIAMIGRMYEVESTARDFTPEARLEIRAEKSRDIYDQLGRWLDSDHGRVLPQSPLARAIGYARNHWPQLGRFLEDGQIPIDNNAVERSLRDVGIGRKNWLFVGSGRGGRAAATIYTIIQSARRHNLDLWQYLTDILPRLADLGPGELETLLPNHWHPKS